MLRNEKALFLTLTNAKKDEILAKYSRSAKNIVSYQSQTNGRLARSENPNKEKQEKYQKYTILQHMDEKLIKD